MEARHASLGRRTLEEIRQKRAAERLSKASSVSDLQVSVPPVGMIKSESGNRLTEMDVNGLVSQIKELERKNLALEDENKNLGSKLQFMEAENDTLQKRLNDLEQNSLPSLRKALRDAAMEKDAAVTAREDMSTQLRMVKKRLKEAEEEQYKTEEQAEAMRAELNSLQQQAMMNPFGGQLSMGNSPAHLNALEKEIADLKSELQQESMLREKDRQRLAEEQARISALLAENQALEEKIADLSKKILSSVLKSSKQVLKNFSFAAVFELFNSDAIWFFCDPEATEDTTGKGFSAQEKEKLEKQLHDMAVMIERLESSRQKLLVEIDLQSAEIENLFEENSNLLASYKDATEVALKWENQVNECLKKNEDLRTLLEKFRAEQANMIPPNDDFQSGFPEDRKDSGNQLSSREHTAEILLLKGQLAKEQSRAEELSAEVMKLSAHLQHTVQAYNGLTRLYKPVLRKIESSLMQMKRDGSVAVQ